MLALFKDLYSSIRALPNEEGEYNYRAWTYSSIPKLVHDIDNGDMWNEGQGTIDVLFNHENDSDITVDKDDEVMAPIWPPPLNFSKRRLFSLVL